MSHAVSTPDFSARIALAADLLKKLAHPGRLMILNRLLTEETSVAEMESELGLKQPGLSQQLAELRNAGLIEARRGTRGVAYRIVNDDAKAVVSAVRRVFLGVGAPVEALAQTQPATGGNENIRQLFGAALFARVGDRA